MKKILALVLALMLVLASVAALADDNYTIAIKNETSGFSYNAYQLFTADLSGDTLSNVQWGNGITAAGKAALRSKYGLTELSDAQKDARQVAEAIAADTATNPADDIATLLAKTTSDALGTAIPLTYSESIVIGSAAAFKGYAATNQVAGYYLIVNTAVPAGADDITYSDYIVEVVQDVAVVPKSGKPESEKKVNDINDSTGDAGNLQDSADHDIGDSITYTLTAKLPSDYANYDKYWIEFQDDMSEGLTYNGDAKIYYGSSDTTGVSITFTEDTTATSDYTNGKVYKAAVEDVKTAAPSLAAGDTIKIVYTATLNKNAKFGYVGNPNKYRIEYFNNPNNTGEGAPHGTTPWDINIVFTYKTVFTKEDGTTHEPLTGADFELYKFIKSDSGTDTYKEMTGTWTKVTDLHTGENKPTKTVENYTKTIGEEEKTAENAKFTFAGLDDGYYKLVETQTPATYNTIDDVYFTITAEHEVKADDPKLTSLSGTDGATFTMTAVKSGENYTGELDANIDNNKGTQLPETGGIGTTLFYVGGGILVLLAVVLLVTKRRMSSND